jgi:hypothetical protein
MATNSKLDFDKLYKSVCQNLDEVQLLIKVESRFARDYMKTQDKHDKGINQNSKQPTS